MARVKGRQGLRLGGRQLAGLLQQSCGLNQGLTSHQGALLQPAKHGAAMAGFATELLQGQRTASSLKIVQKRQLALGEPLIAKLLERSLDLPKGPWRFGGRLAALAKPGRGQGALERLKTAGMAALSHGFNQALPGGRHRRGLEQGIHRLKRPTLKLCWAAGEQLHHKTRMGTPPQAHPHEITHRQGKPGGVGIGEELAFTACFQPHLDPVQGQCVEIGAHRTCKGVLPFLGCRSWAVQ